MEVITNYFHQVMPPGSGQYHNSLVLSSTMPNTIIFNNKSYNGRWGQTVDRDGQWREITESFSRYSRDKWPTEHYVRTGKDTYILQYRRPSNPCHRASAEGIFYDVPLKILRCLSFSRSASAHVFSCVPVMSIFGHYLQVSYDATGDLPDSDQPLCITDGPVSAAVLAQPEVQ